MQIAQHVHAFRIPFSIPLPSGKALERFVYVYLVDGDRLCLIDGGVAGTSSLIADWITAMGRDQHELDTVVITHAHPDHIGGLQGVEENFGCRVAAHADAWTWIQDTDRQYAERPVPGFDMLVEGSCRVDRRLDDGDALELGRGCLLEVIHTPGHAHGHIALWMARDGILFAGDAIPLPGSYPIYDDPRVSLESLMRLQRLEGLKVLLSSWDEPRYGAEPAAVLRTGAEYIRNVHRLVGESLRSGIADTVGIARNVFGNLGLPTGPLSPILLRSIEAHVRCIDAELPLQA